MRRVNNHTIDIKYINRTWPHYSKDKLDQIAVGTAPEDISDIHNIDDRCLPGWAGSYAETHVPLLGEGVIPQLFEVLRPQVFVRVPGQCILTWYGGWYHEILVYFKKQNKKTIPARRGDAAPQEEKQAIAADISLSLIWS